MTKKILAVVLAVVMAMSVLCINVAAADDVEELFSKTLTEAYTGSWMTIIPQADTAKFIEACKAEDSTVTVTVAGIESHSWAQFILQNKEGSVTLEGGKTSGNTYTISGALVAEAWESNDIENSAWYQICFQGTSADPACDITVTVTAPEKEDEPEDKPSEPAEGDPGYVAGPLTLDNYGTSGWSSAYDAAAKTVTFESSWTGRGWWIGTDAPMTGYDSIKIAFPKGAEISGQVVVEYVDSTSATVPFAAGDKDVTAELNHEVGISQIYIQCGSDAGTLTLGDVLMHAYYVAPSKPAGPTTTVETEIEADVKNCSDELTIIKLPETVANGETIKLHVKGSSKGDFRMWLAGGQTTLCADPQWKASEQLDDYTAFDFTVELTCAPQNAGGAAGTADGILFKGPSYGVNLDGLTIDYIAIVTEVEVEQPTTKVEEVSYSMEKTGGDQFEDKSLAGGLNLEKDAEYGLCRIASSWVGGGSVYNAIIAALQSSDGGNLKITFTGDFEGLTFQADGIESTLAPEDFTITYVGNNNVASIPVADVLKAFAEGIAADSWKNIVLNYGDQLTLYAFEITTFKEVVIDEPTDTTDNTPFGYAIQTGNNKYHGFRIGPFMISMPHRFVNGICPICHQRAPKTTDASALIEADEETDEAETVEPAPAKPTYTASEDALYVLEKTSGQNFEDVTIAGGADLVTSDGRTRLATSWVGGGTVYNDLIKALQDNEDAVIKITYTGTITAFGIESENAGIIDVECEVTEGDEFNTMTCNVADFLEAAKKAIEDTSWRNVYLVAEDGAVLYGFEIVAAE